MDEILHANIFFVIASVATVIFCILTSLILWQILKLIKTLHAIMEKFESGSERIAQDVAHVRNLVANGGVMSKAVKFFVGSYGRRPKRQRDQADDE